MESSVVIGRARSMGPAEINSFVTVLSSGSDRMCLDNFEFGNIGQSLTGFLYRCDGSAHL